MRERNDTKKKKSGDRKKEKDSKEQRFNSESKPQKLGILVERFFYSLRYFTFHIFRCVDVEASNVDTKSKIIRPSLLIRERPSGKLAR